MQQKLLISSKIAVAINFAHNSRQSSFGEFIKSLKQQTSLRSIKICNVHMNLDRATLLAAVLTKCVNLNALSLSGCNLNLISIKALAITFENLEFIDLALNNLGAESIKVICESLVKKNKIKYLNFSNNFSIGDQGIKHFKIFFEKNSSLKYLALDACSISRFVVPKSSSCPLETLKLNNNLLNESGIIPLLKMLTTTRLLTTLELLRNKLSATGISALFRGVIIF